MLKHGTPFNKNDPPAVIFYRDGDKSFWLAPVSRKRNIAAARLKSFVYNRKPSFIVKLKAWK